MQGTQVQSLVRELRPHILWNNSARAPTACTLQQEKSPQQETLTPQLVSSPHSLQLEEAHAQQQRPSTAINK